MHDGISGKNVLTQEDDGSLARQRLIRAWEQVCEDLHRDEAMFNPRLAGAPECGSSTFCTLKPESDRVHDSAV